MSEEEKRLANNAAVSRYYWKHKEQILAKHNTKEYKQKLKTYQENNRPRWADSWLRRAYGISIDIYNDMYKAQEGCCSICKNAYIAVGIGTKKDRGKFLCVDHDHKTRKVRELLCENCNRAVGLLQENIVVAKNLVGYLEKHVQMEK